MSQALLLFAFLLPLTVVGVLHTCEPRGELYRPGVLR